MEKIVLEIVIAASIALLLAVIFSRPNSKPRKNETTKGTTQQQPKSSKQETSSTYAGSMEVTEAEAENHNYTKAYKPKWMFSYNEKDAYKKIKKITDPESLIVFAKVRLFDLIEPRRDTENYKGAMWKIQAKHVDFVICDEKLVAHWIIELDDSSHDSEQRQQRDNFVDSVLTSCGYKVLHTKNITEAEIRQLIEKK